MAITDVWEAGRGKLSLGSKSLVLPPLRATVRTADRLVFFVTFSGRGSSLGRAIPMFDLQIRTNTSFFV